MFCDCFYWNKGFSELESESSESKPFSLPSPLPRWPQGRDFATGRINLGEIQVVKVTEFDRVWKCVTSRGKSSRASFYKPVGIPEGFHCLGHYSQPNNQPLKGFVLAARANDPDNHRPPLKKPVDYSLVWSSDSDCNFWLPNPPAGYKAVGVIVTDGSEQPEVEEVRCVREDLTESCETGQMILGVGSFNVWSTEPSERGIWSRCVSVGSFFCSTNDDHPSSRNSKAAMNIACLKNLDPSLQAMPNLDQVHALIHHYGPTVYFHPEETYMPSSVPWFFKNGSLLYRFGKSKGEPINSSGSNLPAGGENDGTFWIDLPEDDEEVKKGNLESSELYVHVKPALGGVFTDIVMWIFCPFNGPATLKIGLLTVPMNRIGEHVGDWEHFTFRISNFDGELTQMFFSQHSGGGWVDASDLEFVKGSNKPVVYSSKHGHASFPHPGMYLQGSSKLGIGVRNDVAKSEFAVDSSRRYKVVAAEYLGEGVVTEPCWLQYMREWGPTIVYDSAAEIDKIVNLLPLIVRYSIENLFPIALYGEEGPTGPKEKDNWEGDEMC
uniref:Vacuolar protein sorting-associated protein 62 n=1 Tax=Noccaea caerulescens TaxID=107243 RepID=A0A1J3FYZ5_NOCCA